MLAGSSLHIVALGLMIAYCAAPGAVNAETVRRGLSGGFLAALLVQLGAVTGRVLWASVALAGTGAIAHDDGLHAGLALIGGIVLLRTAWQSLVASSTRDPCSPRICAMRGGDFTAGLLISLTNPFALVFWSGLVSVLGLEWGGNWDVRAAPLVLATLGFGALAWSVGAAAIVGWGRHALRRGTLRLAELVAGGALGLFGLRMVWETTTVLAAMASH